VPASVWRTRTGVYRNSGTLSVDVEAYAAPGDVSIVSVDFTVTLDGGSPTVVSVTAPELRTPNYSDGDSPVPGVVPSSGMAPTFMYGFDLDFATFADKAEVTAEVVVSGAGGPFTVPGGSVIAYRADSANRPNTATKYCNYDTGSDSTGDGSNGNPYKTARKAADEVLATHPSRDGGGGRVIVQPCELIWFGNGGLSDWYTSEHWPFTIEFQDGVVIRTKDDGTESPIFGAYGIDGANNRNFIKLVGSGSATAAKIGSSFDVSNPQRHPQIWTGYKAYPCEIWLWIDGLRCGSQHWTEGQVSIRFDEPTEPGGLWLAISGANATWKRWGSCLRVEGASDHIVDFTDAHDCVAQDCSILFFGGSTSDPTTHEMSYSLCNVVAHNMKIGVEEERGYVDLMPLGSGDLVASTQSGGVHDGKLRIDHATDDVYGTRYGLIATDKVSTLTNFEEVIGAQLQGADYWYAYVKNWPSVEALGSYVVSGIYSGLEGAQFRILEAGTNGSGRPYVILDAVGIATENCPAPSGSVYPRIFNGNADLSWAPHGGTDHMFQAPNQLVDSIRSNVCLYDLDGTQGPFMEVVAITRCAFVNYNHYSQQGSVNPGIYYLPWAHASMAVTDLVIANCSWGGSWYFDASQTWSNCLIVNNVFREIGPDGPADGVLGSIVSHNHRQVGGTWGANGTTGDWYLVEPQSSTVHSFEPTLAAKGYSTYSFPAPAEFLWPEGYTRGGWTNSAEQDWFVEPDGPSVYGFLPLFGAGGTAEAPVSGSFDGLLPFWLDSFARVAIAADAEGLLPIFGGGSDATTGGVFAAVEGFLPLFGAGATVALGSTGGIFPGEGGGDIYGFLPMFGRADSFTATPVLAQGLLTVAVPYTGTLSRVIRAPGRIVINPTQDFRSDAFPFGGREIGRANLCSLTPLGQRYLVENEGMGEVGDILQAGNRWVFACFVRGWDDDALELLMANGWDKGDRSQHSVFSAPGSQFAGRSALHRGVVLAFIPDDLINVPAVVLYHAVPDWTDGSEMAFRRGEELGLPLTFECMRDDEGRILKIGRLVDLDL